jgi:hypothetical protein
MLKTLWHRLLSKLFEIVLSPLGVTILSELQSTSNPPKIDILLLRRNSPHWTPQQMALLPDGIRDRHATHHLLECKLTESINEESFQQALTYDYLYRQSQQVSRGDMQTYIVSAHTPRAVHLQAWGYTVSEHTGVYVSSLPLLQHVVLLVLNELSDAPHNDFIRLFASRQRVRGAALHTLLRQPFGRWPSQFWAFLFGLQRLYKVEGADMRRDLTVEDVLEIGEEMRKQVIASAAPEERLVGLAPAERLDGLAPEERLAGLKPEELQALLHQLETYLGESSSHSISPVQAAVVEKRQALIHVLQHKFGELPSAIVNRITASVDQKQITEWLDEALEADALAKINFS